MRTIRFLLLLWLGLVPALLPAQSRLTLEDIHASPMYFGASFQGGRWAQEGPVVLSIQRDDLGTHIESFNLETRERARILDGSTLMMPDVNRRLAIEDYAYSANGQRVLLYTESERVWRYPTQGFYYVYDVASGALRPLSDRALGMQMFAKLSPDNRHAAFVRNRNLFLVDLETGTETALTTDGAPGTLINGTTDWVYEEEFGLRDGFQFSPDGRHIAFIKLDESATRDFFMADLRGLYPEKIQFRYPKAGEVNSQIQVGVVGVQSREVRYFDTGTWFANDARYEYIPLFGWTPRLASGAHEVWIFRMNRHQNHLDVLYGHPETMAVRTMMSETSETWLDVETGFNDLEVGALTYLQDGRHFIWVSERDGFRHLYLYTNEGQLVRQLTQGAWDVTNFLGADLPNNLIYYVSTMAGSMERHVYRQYAPMGDAPRPRGRRTPSPEPQALTTEAGWHSAELSRDRRYLIHRYSNVTTPTIVRLLRTDGTEVTTLQPNTALIERLAGLNLPQTRFTQVPGADGTPLNTQFIFPATFDSTRQYPVLQFVYGGPGSQQVRNAWGGSRYLWHQYLADELDLVVAVVDNRGTGGRGRDFRSSVYLKLGQIEAADQIAAARAIGALPWTDASRHGIWGWSYGGYLALMAQLTTDGAPNPFTVSMAVAPVTDWRQYDTIYTERYMRTPQENAAGYTAGAPVALAANFDDARQRMLIVHGDLDDNVHFQNAIQLADALQRANKQFDFAVYPGRDHGIGGGRIRLHLHRFMTEYLRTHLATP